MTVPVGSVRMSRPSTTCRMIHNPRPLEAASGTSATPTAQQHVIFAPELDPGRAHAGRAAVAYGVGGELVGHEDEVGHPSLAEPQVAAVGRNGGSQGVQTVSVEGLLKSVRR
jgi:hypothetical protein